MYTLKSNKDGARSDRHSSYLSAVRCSYSVIDVDGKTCGRVEWVSTYPLSKIRPDWVGRGAWVAYGLKHELAAQKLSTLRKKLQECVA